MNIVKIVGNYTGLRSIECSEPFVSQVTLCNKKDKAVAVFCIYLKVFPNYYIILANYENNPLIISSFSTINVVLGPIQGYLSEDGARVTLISKLFSNNNRKQEKLILSTDRGKYAIKKKRLIWTPSNEQMKYYFTKTLYPLREEYKGKYIGDTVKYIIEIEKPNEIILINSYFKCDYDSIKGIRITPEVLNSAETLQTFLSIKKNDGLLICESIKVINVTTSYAHSKNEELFVLNKFEYSIYGKLCAKKEKKIIIQINNLHKPKVSEKKKEVICKKIDKFLEQQKKIINKIKSK